MNHLVFFLEEPSAREMLNGLLPRLHKDIDYRCIVFEGKQDLEKNLVKKMRGYRIPDSKFIVLRDQDSADCKKVKTKLVELCNDAGQDKALVRIACYELESWYLGDLQAVERGLNLSRQCYIRRFATENTEVAEKSFRTDPKNLLTTEEKLNTNHALCLKFMFDSVFSVTSVANVTMSR